MKTVQWGRRALPRIKYNRGEGRWYRNSTMGRHLGCRFKRRGVLLWRQYNGERGVTMETVQWGRGVLPWTQYNGGKGCYHGDGIVGERGVTMDTVQWGRGYTVRWGSVTMGTAEWERGLLP
jgi:hypothetical protein